MARVRSQSEPVRGPGPLTVRARSRSRSAHSPTTPHWEPGELPGQRLPTIGLPLTTRTRRERGSPTIRAAIPSPPAGTSSYEAQNPYYKGGHPIVVEFRIGKCAGQGRAEAVLQAMPYFQREVSPAGWMQWAVLQAMRSSQRDAATSQAL